MSYLHISIGIKSTTLFGDDNHKARWDDGVYTQSFSDALKECLIENWMDSGYNPVEVTVDTNDTQDVVYLRSDYLIDDPEDIKQDVWGITDQLMYEFRLNDQRA